MQLIDLYDTISDNLKMLRSEKGLNREDVAKYLKIPTSTYGNYESGANLPDYAILMNLSRYYGVSVDYIIGNTRKRDFSDPAKTKQELLDMIDLDGLSLSDLETVQKIVTALKNEKKRKSKKRDNFQKS